MAEQTVSQERAAQEQQANGSQSARNGQLAKALLAAQEEMPAVKPDATNPHFKNEFVSLGHLIAKVRPVLNKHGIAFAQFPSADEAGKPTLVTILMHESGEQLEYDAPLFLPKNDPQGQGSAITYMRRYALASALGISDQEDDDGNAGSAGGQEETADAPAASAEELKAIQTALKGRTAGNIRMLLVAAGVQEVANVRDAVASLTQPEAQALIEAIEQEGS